MDDQLPAGSHGFDEVIVGNGLSALVAAAGLGRRGRRVALVNPTGAWGGHFQGTVIDGHAFDHGMVVFELDSLLAERDADLRTYDPHRRYDASRFCDRIERFVRRTLDIVETPTPLVWWRGQIADDLLLANRLDLFRLLPPATRARMQAELTALAKERPPWHASRKLRDPALFIEIDYERASLANHGQCFHELFIEPMVRKILFAAARDIPALFHRVPWLPLYYPETLRSQFGDAPQVLLPICFHYPRAGCFRALVDALQDAALACPDVTVLETGVQAIERGATWRLRLADGREAATTHLVWGLDPARLLSLAGGDAAEGADDRASLALAFVLVDASRLRRDVGALFLIDPDIIAYRITNQTRQAGRADALARLVIELNADYAAAAGLAGDEAIGRYAADLLLDLGIVDARDAIVALHVRTLRRVFQVPSFRNLRRFQALDDQLARRTDGIRRMGAAAGFVARLVNDHIVQGLQLVADASAP